MSFTDLPPPHVSLQDPIYTSKWCEENAYRLAQILLSHPETADVWRVLVVFISNPMQSVALWQQKIAANEDDVVVWDYHVVLLLQAQTPRSKSWIYDYDTRLEFPCPVHEYITRTFRPLRPDIREKYGSVFRIVPGQSFVDRFASDRSHMLADNPRGMFPPNSPEPKAYIATPPGYPQIKGRLSTTDHNLFEQYVSMIPGEEEYGEVVKLENFVGMYLTY